MRRCMRRLKLPGRALDDRPKDDLIPMRLEQLPQQPLERGLIGRQRKDLDDMPVIVGYACRDDRGLRHCCGGYCLHLRSTICGHHSMPSSLRLRCICREDTDTRSLQADQILIAMLKYTSIQRTVRRYTTP